LTANTVNGGGNGARSGAQTLILLAVPLNVFILRALAGGPKQQVELRREAGAPAQSTLRAQLKRLTEIGALEKHRRNRFPGALEYELTGPGRDLLFVVDALECWLERAADKPLELGGNEAKAAIQALAEGWSTTMLRALAAGPLSLTELDKVIGSLSYPSLERRLAAMRLAGQLEPRPGDGRRTPYAVTNWLRRGVAPLAAAARWERRHQAETTPPFGRLDVEAAFLLVLPALRLAPQVAGTCRMVAEIPNGRAPRSAGVTVEVKNGAMTTCTTNLRGAPSAWAHGSTGAWLDAVIESDTDRLELGGNHKLAGALIDGLHRTLFEAGDRSIGHRPLT
jgi:DNA-binding HxlR family transcriptional regulator